MNRENSSDYDSEDDIEKVPNLLVLKPQNSNEEIRKALNGLPAHLSKNLPERALQTNKVKEQIGFLTELFVRKNPSDKTGGWQMQPKMQIVLDVIGRDEFKRDESRVMTYFCQGAEHTFTLSGVIVIPDKVLIGVGHPIPGLAEVPCLVLAKCNWPYNTNQTIEFCDRAVQSRASPFRDLVKTQKSKQAEVKCRFADIPVSCYFTGLEQDLELGFTAETIY